MTKRDVFLIVIGIVAVPILAYATLGGGLLQLVAIGTMVPLSVIVLTWLITLVRQSQRGLPMRKTIRELSIIIGFSITLWGSLLLGQKLRDQAIQDATAFPLQLRPPLDVFFAVHSRFPVSLDELPQLPPLPRLLSSKHSYESDGKTWYLRYSDPRDMMGMDEQVYYADQDAWYHQD